MLASEIPFTFLAVIRLDGHSILLFDINAEQFVVDRELLEEASEGQHRGNVQVQRRD
jgi:hypothetical protein